MSILHKHDLEKRDFAFLSTERAGKPCPYETVHKKTVLNMRGLCGTANGS